MTTRMQMSGNLPRKPKHYELLLHVWQAAAAEPIGLLVRVPEENKTYWHQQLYKVRSYANAEEFFELEIGSSRFPDESNLQITRKARIASRNVHSEDLDLTGILNLDLPED